jgi:hypothetical protein
VGPVKVQVHFNAFGQILSVSEMHDGTEEHPPAGVLLPPEYRTLEAEVERDEPLIVFHTSNRVSVERGRFELVRVERPSRGKTS